MGIKKARRDKHIPETLLVSIRSESAGRNGRRLVWNGVLSLFLSCGFLLSLFQIFDIRTPYLSAVLLSAAVLSIAAVSLLLYRKKTSLAAMIFPAAASLLVTIIFFRQTAQGLLMIWNSALCALIRRFGRNFPLAACAENAQDSWILFSVAAAGLLVAGYIAVALENGGILLTTTLAVAAAVTACLMGVLPSVAFLISMLLAALCIYLRNAVPGYRDTTIRNQRKKSSQRGKRGDLLRKFLFCSLAVVLAVILYFYRIPENWQSAFEALKTGLSDSINEFRYGHSSVMPEGNFTRIAAFIPDKEAHLEVLMSRPDSLYLRGFVGSVYQGDAWVNLPAETLAENVDLFYWLHCNDFWGQTQLASLSALLGEGNSETNQITVKNMRAPSRYLYAPYEVLNADENLLDPNALGDSVLSSPGLFGSRLARFEALPNLVSHYTDLANTVAQLEQSGALLDTYLYLEGHYNEFVYKNYTELSDGTRYQLEEVLGVYDADSGHLSYAEAKKRILENLESQTYNVDAEPLAKGGDLLQSFLTETKRGYSVHYATAATLMFRYFGIPARYVEGYLITPDDTADIMPYTAIRVTGERAHAWTEFYQDGLGWIPFETTPPYVNVMKTAQDLYGDRYGARDDTPQKEVIKTPEPQTPKSPEQGADEMLEIVTPPLNSLLYIALLLLILLLTAVLFLTIRKQIKIRRQMHRILTSDHSRCVLLVFYGTVRLLCRANVFQHPNDVYTMKTLLAEKVSEEYAALYERAFAIYEAVRFGGRRATKFQRGILLSFANYTVAVLKKRLSFFQALHSRYILCLYP